MCNSWKACDDHAKKHAASVTHPRRGGEEEVKKKVELVMNEVAGTDEGSSGNGGDKRICGGGQRLWLWCLQQRQWENHCCKCKLIV